MTRQGRLRKHETIKTFGATLHVMREAPLNHTQSLKQAKACPQKNHNPRSI